MTVQEALRQLVKAIENEDEGTMEQSFVIAPYDTLQITVVRKRNKRVLLRRYGRLDEATEPYALQGPGRKCAYCNGTGSAS